jgi:hypothetical protein
MSLLIHVFADVMRREVRCARKPRFSGLAVYKNRRVPADLIGEQAGLLMLNRVPEEDPAILELFRTCHDCCEVAHLFVEELGGQALGLVDVDHASNSTRTRNRRIRSKTQGASAARNTGAATS